MSDLDTVRTDRPGSDTSDGDPVGTPPGVGDEEDDEGGGDAVVHVTASIYVQGRRWSADAFFPDVPDDATLADELVNVVKAVAAMRGPGVFFEVSRRLGGFA